MHAAPATDKRIRISDAALAHARGIHYVDPETEADRLARDLGDHEGQHAFYGAEDGEPAETFARLREPVPSAFAAD